MLTGRICGKANATDLRHYSFQLSTCCPAVKKIKTFLTKLEQVLNCNLVNQVSVLLIKALKSLLRWRLKVFISRLQSGFAMVLTIEYRP